MLVAGRLLCCPDLLPGGPRQQNSEFVGQPHLRQDMTRLLLVVLMAACAWPLGAQAPECTYDSCALLFSYGPGSTRLARGLAMDPVSNWTHVPEVRVLAAADNDIRSEYQASRRAHSRAAIFGNLALAAAIGSIAYYVGDTPRDFTSPLGLGFPLATVGFSMLASRYEGSANRDLREAVWLYNRELWYREGTDEAACPYDRCALWVQPGRGIVQGADSELLASFDEPIDLLSAGSDSVRTHYQAYRDAVGQSRRPVLLVYRPQHLASRLYSSATMTRFEGWESALLY